MISKLWIVLINIFAFFIIQKLGSKKFLSTKSKKEKIFFTLLLVESDNGMFWKPHREGYSLMLQKDSVDRFNISKSNLISCSTLSTHFCNGKKIKLNSGKECEKLIYTFC